MIRMMIRMVPMTNLSLKTGQCPRAPGPAAEQKLNARARASVPRLVRRLQSDAGRFPFPQADRVVAPTPFPLPPSPIKGEGDEGKGEGSGVGKKGRAMSGGGSRAGRWRETPGRRPGQR